MVDTRDLKSLALNGAYRFESDLRHMFMAKKKPLPIDRGFFSKLRSIGCALSVRADS